MTTRRLLLFAGPNGSGKSTLTTPETLAHFGIPANRYINADDIARELITEMPDAAQEEREREAFRRARSLRQTYRDEGMSFAFETVFSHPSTLLDMARCRAMGFEIVVLFVTTDDPTINVARVAGRVRSGGHAVPEDRIRQRYERAMHLLPRIVEDADRAFVYNNSGDTVSVFPFVGARAGAAMAPLPAFLRLRLVQPLVQRQAEKQAILASVGVTIPPDENAGIYDGGVVWRSAHFLVQESGNVQVLHDRLLTAGEVQVGDRIMISYREGVGTIAPLHPSPPAEQRSE